LIASDEERLRIAASAFEHMAEGVMILDAARRIVSVNNAFCTITGYPAEEVLGKAPTFLRSGEHSDSFYTTLWKVIGERGRWKGEMVLRREDGARFTAFCSMSAVIAPSGRIQSYVCVLHDISSSKLHEEKLEFLAHHDALTQLPNRVRFSESFRQAIARARRTRRSVAALFIDLDRFKTINDSLGHHAGDALLQELAERLSECVRESDVVARFGGDEFAVMIDELHSSEDAAKVAAKILEVLAQPLQIGTHQVGCSGSVGIACYPNDGSDVEALLKNADTAMYRAKAEGRNTYRFFSPEMNERALEALALTRELRTALERGEFVLHFQPRHDLRSGTITGLEALVRWRHPRRGLLAPAEFIPLAEETGLIAPLGEWVIRAACEQLAAWRARGLANVRMAVNLSPRQFAQPHLAQSIGAILAGLGLGGEGLEIEITEGVIMKDAERSVRTLRELKAMNIAIGVDDFGAGFSSLGYLKRFPLDELKIDRNFVREIDSNPADVAIVQAILALAKGLNLQVIAEGVETQAQRDVLRLCGCEQAQGFFYGKPRPAEEIERLFAPGADALAGETSA
jgi:diguanylate cyclase (GGDEF)-like protein/PAS domain S-box-containing protein